MQINPINKYYQQNIPIRRSTGYIAVPQINFCAKPSNAMVRNLKFLEILNKTSSKNKMKPVFRELLNENPMLFGKKNLLYAATLLETAENLELDKKTIDGLLTGSASASEENIECRIKILNQLNYLREQHHYTKLDDFRLDMFRLTKTNYPLVSELLADFPDEDFEDIMDAASTENDKEEEILVKQKLYKKIKNNEKYRHPLYILSAINSENERLANLLIDDPNIDKHHIDDVLQVTVKSDEDIKIRAYNALKDKEDAKKYKYEFTCIIKHASKNNIECIEELAKNPQCTWFELNNIVFRIIYNKKDIARMLIIDKNLNVPLCQLAGILSHITDKNLTFATKIFSDKNSVIPSYILRDLLISVGQIDETKGYKYLVNNCDDMNKLYKAYEHQNKIVYKSPEDYVNGEFNLERDGFTEVDNFFHDYVAHIMLASDIFDSATVNCILRKRFEDAGETLKLLSDMKSGSLKLLKKLNSCVNADGKPFTPSEKVQFINILQAYADNELSVKNIYEMAKNGKVDIYKIQLELFNNLIKKVGLSKKDLEKVSKEKLMSWNLQYMQLLSEAINDTDYYYEFQDIIKAGILKDDFKTFIHGEDNEYGSANLQTKKMFENCKMNYDKWLNPDKNLEVRFISQDKNNEKLYQIAKQIEEDMNALLRTPAMRFVAKQFSEFIVSQYYIAADKITCNFKIPDDYIKNRGKLTKLALTLSDITKEGQLYQVWERAKQNIDKPEKKKYAQATLTVLNHLTRRVKDLTMSEMEENTKKLDLTIKMWDRNPSHDLFQGNYSTCCIGMGEMNDDSMPHYLLNTAYNMIEIVDNKTGKTIGNALCYFVQDVKGKPVFILDNVEINNSNKPSDEIGKQLRDKITEYALNIAKDVTGRDDVRVCLGASYNDVPTKDLSRHRTQVKFIGALESNCDEVYMDLYDGWIEYRFITDQEFVDAYILA